MKQTIIGIITCGFENGRQFVSQPYIHAIEKSGAVPVILPCIHESEEIYKCFFALCDGFLFCGGDDITPLLLQEEPLTETLSTDLLTDLFQLSFMKFLLNFSKPVLAICRGMQILNAASGGTIWQDLSLRPDSSFSHMQHTQKRSDYFHTVTFKKDSLLYNIFGKRAYTNSYHHQAIAICGKDFIISGTSADLVAESMESIRHPFAVGVQWHPESMFDSSTQMRRLFSSFIDACS